jgi:hypothetical protein
MISEMKSQSASPLVWSQEGCPLGLCILYEACDEVSRAAADDWCDVCIVLWPPHSQLLHTRLHLQATGQTNVGTEPLLQHAQTDASAQFRTHLSTVGPSYFLAAARSSQRHSPTQEQSQGGLCFPSTACLADANTDTNPQQPKAGSSYICCRNTTPDKVLTPACNPCWGPATQCNSSSSPADETNSSSTLGCCKQACLPS